VVKKASIEYPTPARGDVVAEGVIDLPVFTQAVATYTQHSRAMWRCL
jgi:hypothetical protein